LVGWQIFLTFAQNFHLMQSSPKKPQGKHSSAKGKRFDSKENTTNQRRKTSSDKENFSSDKKKATTGREKAPYKKEKPSYNKEKSAEYSPTSRAPYKKNTPKPNATDQSKGIRLNKYIANAGICARREADRYITAGNVEVNGKPMTELGYRVQPTDVVKFDGKNISAEKKEYILLNKPKGFITTTQDEKGRKTVMDLVAGAAEGNIKPVGRLDRLTTGLLLLTNDGDLMKKLTHPSHGVRKIYHVILDKKLALADFHKIQEGLTLEDGFIQVDDINFVDGAPHNEIGVKIHSGRNRIVRRIFESLGYVVEKLDRVVFAGLTKKDLPRGHWRTLTAQEIINLKNLSL